MSDTHDMINHPPHYTATGIEPIDVIEAWGLGYHLGTVIKYLARAPYKGRYLEDLKKAQWFLARKIEQEEKKAQPQDPAIIDTSPVVVSVGDTEGTAAEEPYAPAVNAAKAAFQGLFRFSTQGNER